jgi:hypothetical protein
MLKGSERAPDSTATVPRGNAVGRRSVWGYHPLTGDDSGSGSKLSDSGSTSFDDPSPRRPGPTFPDIAAIL